MTKQLAKILLVAVAAIGLTACGDDSNNSSAGGGGKRGKDTDASIVGHWDIKSVCMVAQDGERACEALPQGSAENYLEVTVAGEVNSVSGTTGCLIETATNIRCDTDIVVYKKLSNEEFAIVMQDPEMGTFELVFGRISEKQYSAGRELYLAEVARTEAALNSIAGKTLNLENQTIQENDTIRVVSPDEILGKSEYVDENGQTVVSYEPKTLVFSNLTDVLVNGELSTKLSPSFEGNKVVLWATLDTLNGALAEEGERPLGSIAVNGNKVSLTSEIDGTDMEGNPVHIRVTYNYVIAE